MTAYGFSRKQSAPLTTLPLIQEVSKQAKEEKAKYRAFLDLIYQRRRLSYIRLMEKKRKRQLQADSDLATIA